MFEGKKHGIFGPSNLDEPEEKARLGRPPQMGKGNSLVRLSGKPRDILIGLANGHDLTLSQVIERLLMAVGDPKFSRLASKLDAERLLLLELAIEQLTTQAGIE
jgi:hypothetical protein